jgi:hypothetical protein
MSGVQIAANEVRDIAERLIAFRESLVTRSHVLWMVGGVLLAVFVFELFQGIH